MPDLLKLCGRWLDEWQKNKEASPARSLLTLSVLLVAIQISPYWYATRDGAEYLSVAKSIATTGEFHNFGSPRTKVPPIYPLLIAPAFWTGERPFLAISMIQACWGILLLGGVYVWCRQLIPKHAVLLTGIIMVNTSLWFYYARTLKEVIFLALLMWTLWVMQRFIETIKHKQTRQIWVWGTLGTLLYSTLCMTRYSAVVLSAGMCLMLLKESWETKSYWLRPLWIPLVVSLLPAVTVYSYLKYDHNMAAVHGEGTYAAAWQEAGVGWTDRINKSVLRRTEDYGRVLLPGMFKSYNGEITWLQPNMLIYIPTILALILGWWTLFRTQNNLFVCLLPFYLLLYLAWPYQQGNRFAVSTLPVAVACYWTGTNRYLNFKPLFLSILFLGHFAVSVNYWMIVERPRVARENLTWNTADHLAAALPPEATDKKHQLGVHRVPSYLHSMLQVVTDRRLYSFKDHPQFYQEANWMFQPAHFTKPDEFEVISTVDRFQLLKRIKSGGELPPLPQPEY